MEGGGGVKQGRSVGGINGNTRIACEMEGAGEINMTLNHAVKLNKVKSKLHIALLIQGTRLELQQRYTLYFAMMVMQNNFSQGQE